MIDYNETTCPVRHMERISNLYFIYIGLYFLTITDTRKMTYIYW